MESLELYANFRHLSSLEQLRILVQTKLNELDDVNSGVPIPDGMVEDGETYFGYELQETWGGSDLNKNYTMTVSLTGRLVRKDNEEENTLSILDNALSGIKEKLKELNFKYSYNDISLQDDIRKIFVKANAKYNEINNTLVV